MKSTTTLGLLTAAAVGRTMAVAPELRPGVRIEAGGEPIAQQDIGGLGSGLDGYLDLNGFVSLEFHRAGER